MKKMSERTAGAAYAVARKRVDGDDQGGASFPLRGGGA